MREFDLIVADIDGTLISDAKVLSPQTIATIQRVRRDFSVDVLLASSRMPGSIRAIQAELGCLDTIVALDGALVIDGPDDHADIVIDKRLSVQTSAAIVHMGLAANAHVGIFRGNEWVVGEIEYWTRREIRGNGNRVQPRVAPVLESLQFWSDAGSAPHKIMIRGIADKLRRLRDAMEIFDHEVHFSYGRPTAIEIVSREAGKWSAVKFLLDRFGIRPERVLAFGDSDNDLELLRSVGHSVVPLNATGRARAIARETTLSNTDNGVAEALSKYFPEFSPR